MCVELRNLLLSHIIRTFNAKLGMLWIAANDEFCTATLNGVHNVVNTKSLVNFLAGFYYDFIRSGHPREPLILDVSRECAHLPENLLKLAEIENLSSLLISPVSEHGKIKGTLVLGTDRIDLFSSIDADLLKLLCDLSLKINESEHTFRFSSKSKIMHRFGLLVGRSEKIQQVYKLISKISSSDANVMIYGESGTGKELIARSIHSHSTRKAEKFVPIDCVALPTHLLESELFGYTKGAFTSATAAKQGLFEIAHGGTVFLDEITEMELELQAKLLRVLQERKIRRLGSAHEHDIDVRIVAATNQDPRLAIKQSKLREDLFYRLNVIPVNLPPLRERKDDIPILVQHFLHEFERSHDHRKIQVTDSAMLKLIHYPWPGNIRELKNIIERVTALAQGNTITTEDLPEEIRNAPASADGDTEDIFGIQPYNLAKERSLMEFERSYFSRLLDKCSGNITRAASEAKVSRKTYNILNKHGLNSYQFVVNQYRHKNETQ